MPSLVQIAAENNRQEVADDAKFFRDFLYYFELIVPVEAVQGAQGSKSFLFPLVLNPQTISQEDTFTVELTPTTRGGLFVEENGVLARPLRISGHTGFEPQPNRSSQGTDLVTTERSSFARRGRWFPGLLSGQRHFQFLQDRVFRTYADLKRDPSTAQDAQLIWHNPKDDEHWLIIPQFFRMERSADRPTLYRYHIEMIAVDKAEASESIDFSEDKPLLDQIRDATRTVQSAIDNVVGAINDVTRFVNDLETVVRGIGSTLDAVSDFVNLATSFVDGTASLIAAPFDTVTGLISRLETAAGSFAGSNLRAQQTITQSFRRMIDGLYNFGLHQEVFQTSVQRQAQDERFGGDLRTSVSRRALQDAASSPPQSLLELERLGTGLLPGDEARARAERGLGRDEPVYSSALQRRVEQGDTMPRIAARYLGDSRLWRRIAILNGLRAPYLSEQGLPNTLRIGDSILIPSRQRPPTAQPLTTVFGVPQTAPLEERLLGTDLFTPESSTQPGFFSMQIDTVGGSTDFLSVTGIPNLSQGIVTRIVTEQGSDVLYRRLGHKPLIGTNIPIVDAESAQFRITEAIAADPRIAEVRSLEVAAPEEGVDSPDVVRVEVDAVVQGLVDPIRTSTMVRG